ncbi:unnamed protein product, partial [Cylicostephanus goldi]
MDNTSTTQLARALSAAESVEKRLRITEQTESQVAAELVRALCESASITSITLPESHRAYIRERFGSSVATLLTTLQKPASQLSTSGSSQESHRLHLSHAVKALTAETQHLIQILRKYEHHEDISKTIEFLSQENVALSHTVINRMTSIVQNFEAQSTNAEATATNIATGFRTFLSETIRELTSKEVTREVSLSQPESSLMTTLLVTLYSLESVIVRSTSTSEQSSQVNVSLGQLQRPEELRETSISLAERRRLQLIHSIEATHEEQTELIKALKRYEEHREITEVLDLLERNKVILSRRVTSQMISVLQENQKVQSREVHRQVVEKLRTVLTQDVQQLTEHSTFALWRTAQPTTSLATLVMTIASIERIVANVTAPENVQARMDASLLREASESVSSVLPEAMRSDLEALLGVSGISQTANLAQREPQESAGISIPERQRVLSSLSSSEYGSQITQTDFFSGYLVSPQPSAEEATVMRKMAQALFLRCAIKATQDEMEQMSVSLNRALEEDVANKVIYLATAQGTNLSTSAVEEIQKAVEVKLQHSESSEEAKREAPERIKSALARSIRTLTDENVYGLWETRTTREIVELVNTLKLLESVALDAFEPTEAATELVKKLRREEPQQLLTKILTEIERISVKRIFFESRTSLEHGLEHRSIFAEAYGQLPDYQRSRAWENVREQGEAQAEMSLTSGILEVGLSRHEDASKTIQTDRKLAVEATASATREEDTEIRMDLIQPRDDAMDVATNRRIPVTVTTSLIGQASTTSDTATELTLKVPEQSVTSDFVAKDRVVLEDSVKIGEISEENTLSTWKTAENRAYSEVTLSGKAKERDQMQSTIQASKETVTQMEQNLARVQELSAEMQVRAVEQQSDSKQFSADSRSEQFLIESKQINQANESATIPDISRTTATSTAREFGFESIGTLGSYGYLQPKQEQQAGIESSLPEGRRLMGEKTLLAPRQEVLEINEILRRDVRGTADALTYTKTMDKSALTTTAAQDERTIKTVDYYQREQIYNAGTELEQKVKVVAEKVMYEAGDEAAFGIWKTAEQQETQTTISRGLGSQEHSSKTVHAPVEETVLASGDFKEISTAETSSTLKLEKADSTSRAFSIEREQQDIKLEVQDSIASQFVTRPEISTASEKTSLHEFGAEQLIVGGILGHLIPKKPETAETMTQITQKPHLSAATTMSASTETNIQTSETMLKEEAMKSTMFESLVSNKEETLLATSATTEEQADVDFQRKRGSLSYGVGKSVLSATTEAAEIKSKETSDNAVFGIWDSNIRSETSQATLREKSLETSEAVLSTKATEESGMVSEVDLSKQPAVSISSTLPQEMKEQEKRGFTIEQLDVTTSYQRCAMGEIAVTTEKDTLLVSSSGSAKEFVKEQAEVVAVLGSIQPKPEQFDSVSVKLSDSKKVELEQRMKAAEEETREKQLSLEKHEASLESTKELKETIVEKEIRSTKASEDATANQIVELTEADLLEFSDVRLKARNVTEASTKVQESREEAVQGLWSTPSGAEASFTLKEKEKSVESGLLSAKAAAQEEVAITEEKIKEIVARAESTVAEKQKTDTSRSYAIEVGTTTEEVTKPYSEAAVREELAQKISANVSGGFREFSQEETALGLVAH